MYINALNYGENRQILQFSGYTYRDMENDLHIFSKIFPGTLRLDSLGETEDGRIIYRVRLGKRDGKKKILIFAGIHGREYMTCQLVMEQMAEFLTVFLHEKEQYQGYPYEKLLEECEFHIVPMANPDGVTISQFGAEGLWKKESRERVWEIAKADGGRMPWKNYFRCWKSNSQGIDVNRNFDAMWDTYVDGIGRPSSEKYKGWAPGCTAESRALIQITEEEKFCRTISYHSSGAVIYWSFGQTGELAVKTEKFAGRIAGCTGYELDDDYKELDPAGYKDWALLKMGIPSITVEIGRAVSPLPQSAYKKILRENRNVWKEVMVDILEEGLYVKPL